MPPPPRRNSKKNIFAFLLVTMIFLAAGSAAHATDYYIATTGNDGNAGTAAAPFRTIQRAVSAVGAGDTVIIKPGRHASFSLGNINGAAGAPITFRGEPGAIIDVNITNYRAIDILGGSYVTIDGLEITDSYSGAGPTSCTGPTLRPGAIKLNRQAGPGTPHPHHMTFKNLHIHGLGGTGIGGSGEYIQFLYNYVHNNGGKDKGWAAPQEAYATYLKGRYNVIRGNRIHDHTGNGIRTGNDESVAGLSELLVDSIIENNITYNNGGGWSHPHGPYGSPGFYCAHVTGGDGIVVWHGSGNIVRNNIAYNNVGYGIRINENFAVSSTPNLVYNNTVYNNDAFGFYGYDGESTIFRNNIGYANGRGDIYLGSGNTQDHNLFGVDPRFVNAAGGDFHLNAGSPAIDAGAPLTTEVPNDFYWGARPFGSGHDIGAIEQGAPPGTPPDGGFLPPPGGGTPPIGGGMCTIVTTEDVLCAPMGATVPLNIEIETFTNGDNNSGHGNDTDGDDDDNPGGD